jgi:hypothetical protein
LENLFSSVGILPRSNLSSEQRKLPVIRRVTFAASVFGIVLGGVLGLINLYFIDTTKSSTLKLHAHHGEQDMDLQFTIEASNAARIDATSLTVEGPDVDGLLASMTAVLATKGASILEIQAKRQGDNNDDQKMIRDVFYVVDASTGEQFDDDDLEDLAQGLLDSTRTPHAVHHVQAKMAELETMNSYLQQRIQKLEQLMYEKQITVVGSMGEERSPRHATMGIASVSP